MLKFNVTGDKLELISSRSFNSGSKGYYTAEFTFDGDWDGLIPHITITENGTERADEVIVGNTYKIATTESGIMQIGVYGLDSNGKKCISSNLVCIEVSPGAYTGVTPMPKDIWDGYQIIVLGYMERAEGAADKAERAAGSIKNLSATAVEGSEVSVTQSESEDGGIKLDFTLPRGDTPQKGVDYFTSSEKNELVNSVFNVLKEMNAFDNVSFISSSKVTLSPGRVYVFESVGDTYKVQLYDQDGNIQSQVDESMGGIIIYPSSGLAKYISIKEKPSSLGLTDLLNFKELFDKLLETATFNVNTEKPNIYIETVDNHKFYCWEISGNSHDLQIGTYAARELIKGITAELSVSFLYPLEFDEYAVAIDGVVIERKSYGGTMRIASELLKAKDTQIVFYKNDEEVIKARVQPTILNCGMLYAIER